MVTRRARCADRANAVRIAAIIDVSATNSKKLNPKTTHQRGKQQFADRCKSARRRLWRNEFECTLSRSFGAVLMWFCPSH